MPPAARIGDNHTCPMMSPNPHIGGPIASGSATVLIDGQPAAVVGSICTCNGPPDPIASGSATVRIEGKPAARMGDATAHGGVVVGGSGVVVIG